MSTTAGATMPRCDVKAYIPEVEYKPIKFQSFLLFFGALLWPFTLVFMLLYVALGKLVLWVMRKFERFSKAGNSMLYDSQTLAAIFVIPMMALFATFSTAQGYFMLGAPGRIQFAPTINFRAQGVLLIVLSLIASVELTLLAGLDAAKELASRQVNPFARVGDPVKAREGVNELRNMNPVRIFILPSRREYLYKSLHQLMRNLMVCNGAIFVSRPGGAGEEVRAPSYLRGKFKVGGSLSLLTFGGDYRGNSHFSDERRQLRLMWGGCFLGTLLIERAAGVGSFSNLPQLILMLLVAFLFEFPVGFIESLLLDINNAFLSNYVVRRVYRMMILEDLEGGEGGAGGDPETLKAIITIFP